MRPRTIACTASLAATICGASAVQTRSQNQQPPSPTPLAGPAGDSSQQPDGSGIEATYDTFPGGVRIVPENAILAASALAPAIAEHVRPRLAEGISLGPGETRRITTGPPAAPDGAPVAEAAPAKFVTLFPLRYRSIPLSRGSDYLALVTADGRLLATRIRNVPASVDATAPTVPAGDAVRAVREHAGEALGGVQPNVSDPSLEILVGPDRASWLTWTLTVESPSLVRPFARRYWVRAVGSPAVARWESLIFHDHNGQVTATVWRTPRIRAHDRPLARVGVNLMPEATRVFTAGDGRYQFPTHQGKASVQSALGGISCVAQNVAGANLTRIGTGDGSTAIDLDFDASGEFELSQTSGYLWCDFAHAFMQFGIGVLRQLPVRVNIDDTCNAFYSSASVTLNFFRAGDGCANTAYQDVVLHEYGHAADDELGGIMDKGYSEGFGDALTVLATRQSCVGRDLFGDGTCLRDANDVLTWPPDGDEPHLVGRVYAGFVWELSQQLSTRLGEEQAFAVATQLTLAAAASNPADIPDAVRLTFLADDDDGDPSTCSPNLAELRAAAASRKLPIPPAAGPGTLEIDLKLSPSNDDGRFNIRVDGSAVLSGAGHGASTGPRSIAAGKHVITQTGASGTDLSEYQTFMSGNCDAQGNVTVGGCRSAACTITNVRASGEDCEKQCRDERDQCLKDPEMLPKICIQIFKQCLATCN